MENKNRQEISDELLACYIEGKVTADERAEVEKYLEQDVDMLNSLLTAHADVVYDQVIKRMNEETFWKRTRFYIIGIAVLIIAGIAAFSIWRLSTPLNMKIKIVQDTTCFIQGMPFEIGTLQCEYAGKSIQTKTVTGDDPTKDLDEIHFLDRKTKVHIVFTSKGYETIDTVVPVQKTLSLKIKRNNDLGLIFGSVFDFNGKPVENATVKILDGSIQTVTDAYGQFRIEIPFAKQAKTQHVKIMKEGYAVYEGIAYPSQSNSFDATLDSE